MASIALNSWGRETPKQYIIIIIIIIIISIRTKCTNTDTCTMKKQQQQQSSMTKCRKKNCAKKSLQSVYCSAIQLPFERQAMQSKSLTITRWPIFFLIKHYIINYETYIIHFVFIIQFTDDNKRCPKYVTFFNTKFTQLCNAVNVCSADKDRLWRSQFLCQRSSCVEQSAS